jgi:hypothetical protein
MMLISSLIKTRHLVRKCLGLEGAITQRDQMSHDHTQKVNRVCHSPCSYRLASRLQSQVTMWDSCCNKRHWSRFSSEFLRLFLLIIIPTISHIFFLHPLPEMYEALERQHIITYSVFKFWSSSHPALGWLQIKEVSLDLEGEQGLQIVCNIFHIIL